MKHTAFDTYHPLIAALYFAAALVFAMAAFQPVFVLVNLLVAVAYNVYLRGWSAVVRTAAWQLPLLIIVAVLNPIFSPSGSTLLFQIGHQGFFLESFVYGILMGLSLVAVMQWFSNLSHVLTSDKIMQLTGNVMPTVGLMITMVLRLVPQFMRRSGSILLAQQVCTSAHLDRATAKGENNQAAHLGFFQRRALAAKGSLRDISVLMGWAMEDSLDTSEAMRARGWGAAAKRSTYRRNDFKLRDAVLLGILAALIVASTMGAIHVVPSFAFYPKLSPISFSWGYVPFVFLLVVPFVLEIKERVVWKTYPKLRR